MQLASLRSPLLRIILTTAALLAAAPHLQRLPSLFILFPPFFPLQQHMASAAAAEFVMGVVSVPAAGGVAQALARLLVSSKVLPL